MDFCIGATLPKWPLVCAGITPIEGFDASEYPTRFAGEIKTFDVEDYITAKEARRLDTCWKYTLVAGASV